MNDSFHDKTKGFGWSQYGDATINCGDGILMVPVPHQLNALALIDVHNNQILAAISAARAAGFAEAVEAAAKIADDAEYLYFSPDTAAAIRALQPKEPQP